MKAQDLKKSILQYAMQGKLVTQDPTDEPASELLRRIRAEKEKLIKEGKIKKEKPLPPITQAEIPYELPQGWEWVRLRDILIKLTDGAHRTPHYQSSGIPFLSVKDISSGYIDFSNTKFISKFEHEELFKRCNPQKGDILLTKVGTTGIPAIVETDVEFSLFVSIALLKFNQNYLDEKYLYNLILSPLVQMQAKENTKGIGNKNWVIDKIAQTLIPLPPLAEQKRIVEKLEEILPLVEEYGKNEEILSEMNQKLPKQIRQSILQYAVQGKLVEQNPQDEPAIELLKRIKAEKEKLIKEGKIKKEKPLPPITKDEIPYELPQDWEWARLGNLSVVNGGYAFKSSEYKNVGIRVVRISDFNESGFVNHNIVRYDYNNKLDDYLLEEKNIILCMTGGTVGKSLFIKNLEEPMVTNQRVATIKILGVIEDYINYSILSPLTQQVITESKNSTNDNISIDTIKNFLIPLPPLSEQKRIVAKVEELMNLVNKLES